MIALPPERNKRSKRRRIISIRFVGPPIPTKFQLILPFIAFGFFCAVVFAIMLGIVMSTTSDSSDVSKPIYYYSSPE